MKRTSKIIVVLAVLVAGSMIASAALIPYFGKITTTVDVSQSVLLDGEAYPDSVTTDEIDGVACNLVLGDTHWLTNKADKKVIVDLVSTKTGCPGGCVEGDVIIYPEYHLDAMIDDDAFWVKLGSNITWSTFVSASFDYLIDYDGGNLWIPQMNIVLRDSEGVGQYYACWHSYRNEITGVEDERTAMTYEKGDFYMYELPSWHLLGLWSDSNWYAPYTTIPGDLGDTYRTTYQTNLLKDDVDLYQFNYFTRQAGCTSNDPNPAEAQQKVWLSNFAMKPARTITGIGIPTPSYGSVSQNLWFRMLYDFSCLAYEGIYTVETTVNYIGTM